MPSVAPLAPSDPPEGHQRREELDVRGERDRPWGADRREHRQRDLGLTDRDAPGNREREDPECQPRLAAPKSDPPDRHDEARDHQDLPDRRGGLEGGAGRGAEQDREERRVGVSEGSRHALVGRIERQSGVQARARPVVGLDVVERVDREVKPEGLDAGSQPDDRGDGPGDPGALLASFRCRGRHGAGLRPTGATPLRSRMVASRITHELIQTIGREIHTATGTSHRRPVRAPNATRPAARMSADHEELAVARASRARKAIQSAHAGGRERVRHRHDRAPSCPPRAPGLATRGAPGTSRHRPPGVILVRIGNAHVDGDPEAEHDRRGDQEVDVSDAQLVDDRESQDRNRPRPRPDEPDEDHHRESRPQREEERERQGPERCHHLGEGGRVQVRRDVADARARRTGGRGRPASRPGRRRPSELPGLDALDEEEPEGAADPHDDEGVAQRPGEARGARSDAVQPVSLLHRRHPSPDSQPGPGLPGPRGVYGCATPPELGRRYRRTHVEARPPRLVRRGRLRGDLRRRRTGPWTLESHRRAQLVGHRLPARRGRRRSAFSMDCRCTPTPSSSTRPSRRSWRSRSRWSTRSRPRSRTRRSRWPGRRLCGRARRPAGARRDRPSRCVGAGDLPAVPARPLPRQHQRPDRRVDGPGRLRSLAVPQRRPARAGRGRVREAADRARPAVAARVAPAARSSGRPWPGLPRPRSRSSWPGRRRTGRGSRPLAGGSRYAAVFAGQPRRDRAGARAVGPGRRGHGSWPGPGPLAARPARGAGLGGHVRHPAGAVRGTYAALPIALALPAVGPLAPAFALAIVAASPIATTHPLPLYAAAILLGSLALREPILRRPLGRSSVGLAPQAR